MDTPEALKDGNWRRRYFVGAAAFTAVAAPLGIIGSGDSTNDHHPAAGGQTGDAHIVRTAEADRCRDS